MRKFSEERIDEKRKKDFHQIIAEWLFKTAKKQYCIISNPHATQKAMTEEETERFDKNFKVFVERVLIDSQDEPNLKINGAQNSSNKSFNSVGFNGREKAFDDYSQLNQSEAEDGDKGGECENSFLERMLDGQANLIAKQESN